MPNYSLDLDGKPYPVPSLILPHPEFRQPSPTSSNPNSRSAAEIWRKIWENEDIGSMQGTRPPFQYPPDWTETDFDQGVPSRRIANPPTSPARAAAKSAAAATKAAPRPGGFDLNSPRGILLQEGLGFGLGGAMSGGFALQAGATPSQALGIAGASVAGDAVGSGLGILAGMALGSFLGPPGTFIAGAVPFATRMIGGTIGSIAGDRWGWKATGAEDTVNRKFQEQQMQQQPMYDPETGQQYMAPPPPPTPEEKLRQQILSAGSNPYLPYMMTGGF